MACGVPVIATTAPAFPEVVDHGVTGWLVPPADSVELAEAIRSRSPEVMIILMTGEPTLETATQGLRLGVIDYLAKPVPPAALLRSVAQAVQIRRLNDEAVRLREADRLHRERLQDMVD